jgi:hypothetical protein
VTNHKHSKRRGPDSKLVIMDEAQDVQVPAQHDLTYPGIVDVETGRLMGRGMNGKIWRVLGCLYNPVENKTTVSLEEFVQQS